MIRFGLIGLGQMGRHHGRILSEDDSIEFVGAVDPAGDRHRVVRGAAVFDDVGRLLDAGVDAVVVAVPTARHHSIAMTLAEEGIHALIEKPLADSVASSREIESAFESAGLTAAVGHVERFNSALQEMKRRLDEGDLGRVISISTERVGPFSRRIEDVGVIKDLASHDIDIASWVGGASFAEVDGRVAHKLGRPHEDLLFLIGTLENDVVVSMNVNWMTPFKRREVRVLGEKGAFVADLLSGELRFHANGDIEDSWEQLAILRGVSEGDTVSYAFPKVEPLLAQHRAFRRAIQTGDTTNLVSLADGVHILEVAEQLIPETSV